VTKGHGQHHRDGQADTGGQLGDAVDAVLLEAEVAIDAAR
jgi:hypothetical protein